MNYDEALKILDSYTKSKVKLGLERIEELLDLLGNPQRKLKTIHVAGTNGKGSICTMLSYALQENGLKIGLFISPHIVDIRERLQINNTQISEKKFAEIFEKIHITNTKLTHKVSHFEALTAMGFEYFASENCDVVVLETGLGGRLDSTNVNTKKLCSVITTISLDHTHILGDTLEKIATEKCGIIRNETPVIVSANQEPAVQKVISEYCKNTNSKVTFCDEKNISKIIKKDLKFTKFLYKNKPFELPLKGNHQLINANTALETLELLKNDFNLSYEKIFSGLKKSYIPGRFEIFKTSNGQTIILDGAHNPGGISALAENIEYYFKNQDLIAICGMLKDKDVTNSLQKILPLFRRVYTVMPSSKRAMRLEEFTKIARAINNDTTPCETPKSAIELAIAENPKSTIIIFGSLYLAGDFHKQYFDIPNDKIVKDT